MSKKEKIVAALILLLVGVAYRLFPHPANFAPVAAISLFSGFYFRRYFIFIPVFIMLLGDIFLGFYDWKLMVAVYSSFVLVALVGILMRKKRSVVVMIGCSLSGSVLFFLLTNFAVWAFSAWYPHNFQGLAECFTMAIPFFKNTLLGDLFYTSVIFGCYEWLAQPKEKLNFLWDRTPLIKQG